MARELMENTQDLFDKMVVDYPDIEPRLRRLIRLVLMDVRNAQNTILADMEEMTSAPSKAKQI